MAIDDPFGDREPRPVPPDGAPLARQNRSKTWGMSSGFTPRPVVLDVEQRGVAVAPDGDADVTAGRAVADRVVDEDEHELAEPRGVALDHRRLRVDLDADILRAGRLGERRGGVGGNVAEIERQPVERDGAGVGAGEEQQVVDERGQVLDLRPDVVEGVADRARPARRRWRRRCSSEARTTVSGVRSS